MATDGFTKQIAEEFTIQADFSNVLIGTESIELGSSSVVAEDVDEAVATDDVLTSGSMTVDGDNLKIRVEGGSVGGSPYKITFLIGTSENNIYEKDVFMDVQDF